VSARTHDGRSVRLLNLIDESTRECLLIRAERRWFSAKGIGALADVMVWKGVPEHLRSDNGPEFVAMLTRNVAEIEAELGVRLFERNRKTVKVTDAGRAYVEKAQLSLLYGEQAFQAAREVGQNQGTVLHVGSPPIPIRH
jgi:hypothetical protein